MNWSLAYEENFKCKDMEIHNVDDIKNAGFEIIENATVPGNVEIDFMKNGKLLAVGTVEELKRKAGCNDFEGAFITIVKEGTV